ncbi:ATP-dependent nuclease [Ectopseudomonas khazarica]|uniref:ATP-dependent nuclease n=1 Tax=Ectopseudomonas khazarica TaxID=2502979 RepID=UPI0037C8FA50
MIRIRKLEIQHFRAIQRLEWAPCNGINCLIGPGDSGKSSILDAIDLCLGARRSASFSDTDFYALDVNTPIAISITLGSLPDEMVNLDAYGDFLRGIDLHTGVVEDEPRAGLETVLTLKLQVASDLEPTWTLYSDRAAAVGTERSLAWKDRSRIAPARIGSFASMNLSWSRNSILNRLTEERPELSGALAGAARQARENFGVQASDQLRRPLDIVNQTSRYLGVPVGEGAQALLDAHAVSVGDGAIALHDSAGIPLRSLGTGSSRLLVAGLQRMAADAASIALVDEVEYGLEPHRLIRFLDSLGAKDTQQPLQVFITTHSPVALRELSGQQLHIVRKVGDQHRVILAGDSHDVQSTLRADPEAFLAKHVIVCEGASEVGLVRGLDQFWSANNDSFLARGCAYVNAGGSTTDHIYNRGQAMIGLGYRVLLIVDADKPASPEVAQAFAAQGGTAMTWGQGRALEDELFASLPDLAIDALILKALEVNEPERVASQIQSKSEGRSTLQAIQEHRAAGNAYPRETRSLLGISSRIRSKGWYKSVTTYQAIGQEIIGPYLDASNPAFQQIINGIKEWVHAG